MFSKGRVYPHGTVVLYRPEEVLAKVKNLRTAWVQGERVPLARVEQVIHRRYLGLLERERLKDLLMEGLSIRKIATVMGRAPSAISREIRRNTVGTSGYLPHTAHRVSVKRRHSLRAPPCPWGLEPAGACGGPPGARPRPPGGRGGCVPLRPGWW